MNIHLLSIILHLWLILCLAIVITGIPHFFISKKYAALNNLEKIVFNAALVLGASTMVILEIYFGGVF